MAFRFKRTLIALAAVSALAGPAAAATPTLNALLAAYKTGNVTKFQQALASMNPNALATELKSLSAAQLKSMFGSANAALLEKDLAHATPSAIQTAYNNTNTAALAQAAINDPSAVRSGQLLTVVTQQASNGQPITGTPVSP